MTAFLSDAWFDKVAELTAAAGDLNTPATLANIVLNITVTGTEQGNVDLAINGGKLEKGHNANASTTLTMPGDAQGLPGVRHECRHAGFHERPDQGCRRHDQVDGSADRSPQRRAKGSVPTGARDQLIDASGKKGAASCAFFYTRVYRAQKIQTVRLDAIVQTAMMPDTQPERCHEVVQPDPDRRRPRGVPVDCRHRRGNLCPRHAPVVLRPGYGGGQMWGHDVRAACPWWRGRRQGEAGGR